MTPKPSLPHGATGIEVGNFVIEFRSDKVVVLAKDRGEHYTLHAGHKSGILDVHRTWRAPDGTERHQTVFAMRHADLPAFLNEFASMPAGMVRLLRRLQAWMALPARHRHRQRLGTLQRRRYSRRHAAETGPKTHSSG